MTTNTEKKHISAVILNPLFDQMSQEFGFQFSDYEGDVLDLIEFWESDGFVEVYTNNQDRAYGRAKASDSGSEPGTIPHLMGLYHVRLLAKKNDPLVIITFDKNESDERDVAHLRFILDHNQIFGAINEKYDPNRLKEIKKIVSEAIRRGT